MLCRQHGKVQMSEGYGGVIIDKDLEGGGCKYPTLRKTSRDLGEWLRRLNSP